MGLEQQSSATVQITREPLVPLGLPLALAMQCWPEAERAEQLEMMRKTMTAGSGFVLLAARRGNELAGAMLAQELPGKSASIFLPQLAAGEADLLSDNGLVQEMLRILAADGIHLCQCLLARNQAAPPSLCAAGLQHSATLLYMTCEPRQFPATPPAIPGFQWIQFQSGEEASLARLIDETYVGTQDCPALNGLRNSRDVVEGYKHVGEFRSEHWLTLVEENSSRAAGCLILAAHPPHPTMELVYVGVVPEFRQRGLGAKLTRHAQWLASQAKSERLVLAVDAANEPAIAMYSATGFWAWEERAIWVKSLV